MFINVNSSVVIVHVIVIAIILAVDPLTPAALLLSNSVHELEHEYGEYHANFVFASAHNTKQCLYSL